MDKLIYTAMTGAKHALSKQAAVAHNLANASTGGFRAAVHAFRAVPVYGEGLPTRALVVDNSLGSDFTPGAIQHTRRGLDVAIQGPGLFAVATEEGEAYTRDGAFFVNDAGLLSSSKGRPVLGDGGPINVPANSEVRVARDGTVSVLTDGGISAAIGRLKLVNPPEPQLRRGGDGLFRLAGGATAPADAAVSVVGGALEASNVNVVEEMIAMIELAREFDLHMNLLKNAEGNARQANRLLAVS